MPASFLNSSEKSITIFTDGSCHSQLKTGGWASIIMMDSEKIMLEGTARTTTHQRMELTAVLAALRRLQQEALLEHDISVYSDSQYVVDLVKRRAQLIASDYRTKKFKVVRNLDLVRELLGYMSLPNLRFIKIKSHQKLPDQETQLNREVDLLSRKNMRKNHR
jgi:ribonuclease HI